MGNILIRNAFYHLVAYHYFMHAFEVYCQKKQDSVQDIDYADLASQKRMFERIAFQIRGRHFMEPSLLNQLHFIFHFPSPYPVTLALDHNEQFWFEYIINIPFAEFLDLFDKFSLNNKLQRLCGAPRPNASATCAVQ